MSDFDRAFAFVIGAEGGYSNDPHDPGGETKYGIADHSDGVIDGKHEGVPIKEISLEGAKGIYRRDYWAPARCDHFPWPLSAMVFDAAVNQGVKAALLTLQKTLGVAQDGIVGPNTLGAVKRADLRELCALYLADRALRYTGTRNFDRYGRGWFKRLFRLAMEAVA